MAIVIPFSQLHLKNFSVEHPWDDSSGKAAIMTPPPPRDFLLAHCVLVIVLWSGEAPKMSGSTFLPWDISFFLGQEDRDIEELSKLFCFSVLN